MLSNYQRSFGGRWNQMTDLIMIFMAGVAVGIASVVMYLQYTDQKEAKLIADEALNDFVMRQIAIDTYYRFRVEEIKLLKEELNHGKETVPPDLDQWPARQKLHCLLDGLRHWGSKNPSSRVFPPSTNFPHFWGMTHETFFTSAFVPVPCMGSGFPCRGNQR